MPAQVSFAQGTSTAKQVRGADPTRLEWILERYQLTRDKDSGIVNDPNDGCKEHNQPRYIIDLIARLVRVSLETMKIVKALPGLNER